VGLNAGPLFKFTEAISFAVTTENQEETDYFWNKLTADGGRESDCGWLKDKFGLSWQITPRALIELLSDKDAKKAARVMASMMTMKKINIAALQSAATQQ
jgi:predicted 3-demethylubiquinone-9 3-methyltransferase (glyoxalase superfamily)